MRLMPIDGLRLIIKGENTVTKLLEYIKPFRGGLSVSNCGRVFSPRGKELKPRVQKNGYWQVSTQLGGKTWTNTIHRIVALTFIPNPTPERNQVDHVDGCKSHNTTDNLRWVTDIENKKAKYEMRKRLGYRFTRREIAVHRTYAKVIIYQGWIFYSIREMARRYGVNRYTIRSAVRKTGRWRGADLFVINSSKRFPEWRTSV